MSKVTVLFSKLVLTRQTLMWWNEQLKLILEELDLEQNQAKFKLFLEGYAKGLVDSLHRFDLDFDPLSQTHYWNGTRSPFATPEDRKHRSTDFGPRGENY